MALRASRIAAVPAHSAGIFADRNLDGPEIGTLVVVVDRAKNLPNLRTMGKQDPYCAARLGKTAKKTETDRRGGQTPRWDQELRFSVYESLDYAKLKVSVFNEEKRTDLIGETWINLEEVIRRGGGQSDAWHELNNKGKYAGQIRIELTYYDTRPKEERTRAPSKQGLTNGPSQDSTPHAAGPRQPAAVKRRPLPTIDASPARLDDHKHQPADSMPLPQTQPRSYHTPPSQVQGGASSTYGDQDTPTQGQDYYADGSDNAPCYDEPPFFDNSDPVVYRGDVATMDSADSGALCYAQSPQADVQPLRHDRVQRLSNAAPSRPMPQGGLPHAYSAPILSHDVHHPVSAHAPFNPEWHSIRHAPRDHASNYTSHSSSRRDDTSHMASGPPAPPIHRSSAPIVQRPSAHQQPLHSAMYDHETHPTYGMPPESHVRHPADFSYDHPQDRRRSEPDHNSPSRQTQHNNYARPMHYTPSKQILAYTTPAPAPRPTGPHAIGQFVPRNEAAPLHKPEATSPAEPGRPSSSHIQRKSVSPRPSPAAPYENGTTSVPFSPDSFSTFNPSSQQISVSPSPFEDSRQPSPMYASRPGNAKASSRDPPSSTGQRSSGGPSTPVAKASPSSLPGSEVPIRDSRGRIVDPSDHLPLSTFAPEPERKGSDRTNASSAATSRSFGPRDARALGPAINTNSSASPAPVSSSPMSTSTQYVTPRTGRLQKRTPPGYGAGSPLAPSPAAVLNAGSRYNGQDYTKHHGPPVPGKVPLDAQQYASNVQEQGSGNDNVQEQQNGASGPYSNGLGNESTSTLSQEMSRIDIGLSPLQKFEKRFGPVAGGGAQRGQRRSRFGP